MKAQKTHENWLKNEPFYWILMTRAQLWSSTRPLCSAMCGNTLNRTRASTIEIPLGRKKKGEKATCIVTILSFALLLPTGLLMEFFDTKKWSQSTIDHTFECFSYIHSSRNYFAVYFINKSTFICFSSSITKQCHKWFSIKTIYINWNRSSQMLIVDSINPF